METNLKKIRREGIPKAISKAETYRYLNEPDEAESILRDVLAADPENQEAIRLLGLALTDQFTGADADRAAEAERVFQGLVDPYARLYYRGIVRERRGKALLRAGRPLHSVRPLFEEAMRRFEEAERSSPAGNEDAKLRWNRCARLLGEAGGAAHAAREPEPFETGDAPPI